MDYNPRIRGEGEQMISVVLTSDCSSCSFPNEVRAGQSIHDDRIVWWKSYKCVNCGSRFEEDGKDQTPDEIRNAIFKNDGHWSFVLDDQPEESHQNLLKLLRNLLNLSLAETARIKRYVPGPIASGTRIEMERLIRIFNSHGLHACMKQINATD